MPKALQTSTSLKVLFLTALATDRNPVKSAWQQMVSLIRSLVRLPQNRRASRQQQQALEKKIHHMEYAMASICVPAKQGQHLNTLR